MCACGRDHTSEPTRRRFVAGAVATLATAAAAGRAAAAGLGDCFDPAALVGTPTERFSRRATVADAVSEPSPARRGTPVTGALAEVIGASMFHAAARPSRSPSIFARHAAALPATTARSSTSCRRNRSRRPSSPGELWLATHRRRALELASDPLSVSAITAGPITIFTPPPPRQSRAEIGSTETELAEVRQAARAACGNPSAGGHGTHRLFRFPFGSCSVEAAAAANAAGSIVIQWDVVSGDPDGTPASVIVHNVLSRVRPGSIVVMHANGRGTHTAEALTTIVPKRGRRLPLRRGRRSARRRPSRGRYQLLYRAAGRHRPL